MSDNPQEFGDVSPPGFSVDFTHFEVGPDTVNYTVQVTNQRSEVRFGTVSIAAANDDGVPSLDKQFDETFERGETVEYQGEFFHGYGAGEVVRLGVSMFNFETVERSPYQ